VLFTAARSALPKRPAGERSLLDRVPAWEGCIFEACEACLACVPSFWVDRCLGRQHARECRRRVAGAPLPETCTSRVESMQPGTMHDVDRAPQLTCNCPGVHSRLPPNGLSFRKGGRFVPLLAGGWSGQVLPQDLEQPALLAWQARGPFNNELPYLHNRGWTVTDAKVGVLRKP
jgi:hypothetical protein